MKFVLSPHEMRMADSTAINEYRIPGMILMENAARSAADHIDDFLQDQGVWVGKVVILCGSGNNGGDGFAVARQLHEKHESVVYWIGDAEKMSAETLNNYQIVKQMGIPCQHIEFEDDIDEVEIDADCYVDALFGVGGSDEIRGLALPLLQKVNDIDAFRVAVDVPSGLNSETGFAAEDCFLADMTVTMFAIKTGMLINDGMEVCGEIRLCYLGAPEYIVEDISSIKVIEDEDLDYLLPDREVVSSKFDFGKVVIIAGSENYPGAAALCSNAAISAGSGLVYLFSTSMHPQILPEVIPFKLNPNDDGGIANSNYDKIFKQIEKADVIALGSGIGDSEDTIELVKRLVEDIPSHIPMVVDADALKAIDINKKLRENIVLTPHIGEFARLIGQSRSFIEDNAADLAKEWADKLDCTILLKHVPTIISNGVDSYWNMPGNPGMATAGSGDVLTGIIAALMAQGVEAFEAASLAAFLHGSAGDTYSEEYSEMTLTASRLITSLEKYLHNYYNDAD